MDEQAVDTSNFVPPPGRAIKFQRFQITAERPATKAGKLFARLRTLGTEVTTVEYRATDFMDALRWAQRTYPGAKISLKNLEAKKD